MKTMAKMLALLFGIFSISASHASTVVDQRNDDIDHARVFVPIYTNPNNWMGDTLSYTAQTFTAGTNGTFAGLDIFGPANFFGPGTGSLTVKLYGGLSSAYWGFMSGSPYSPTNLLGSVTVPSSSLSNNSWNALFVDFSSLNKLVSIGDMFAFEVYAEGQQYMMLASPNMYCTNGACDGYDAYAGGMGTRGGGYLPASDYLFRTYVDVPSPVPVPAPSAFILMLTGLGVFGFAKRFRKEG